MGLKSDARKNVKKGYNSSYTAFSNKFAISLTQSYIYNQFKIEN